MCVYSPSMINDPLFTNLLTILSCCFGPVLDHNCRHGTRRFTDTYRDTDLALA